MGLCRIADIVVLNNVHIFRNMQNFFKGSAICPLTLVYSAFKYLSNVSFTRFVHSQLSTQFCKRLCPFLLHFSQRLPEVQRFQLRDWTARSVPLSDWL